MSSPSSRGRFSLNHKFAVRDRRAADAVRNDDRHKFGRAFSRIQRRFRRQGWWAEGRTLPRRPKGRTASPDVGHRYFQPCGSKAAVVRTNHMTAGGLVRVASGLSYLLELVGLSITLESAVHERRALWACADTVMNGFKDLL